MIKASPRMSQPSCMDTKKAAITMDNRPKTTSKKGVKAHASCKYCLIVIFIPLSRTLEAKIVDEIVTNIFVRLPFEWVLRRSLWLITVRVSVPILAL